MQYYWIAEFFNCVREGIVADVVQQGSYYEGLYAAHGNSVEAPIVASLK
jgi:hypothetical protein